MIVSDTGTEFPSNAIVGFADGRGIEWHNIAPWQTDPECPH
jgi:hypothetical protein